ncbi:MAG: glycosyltransferase [Phycisphaerales bacterium]|nr:glycosyltransferase [Planctomycetota bacterium]
MRVVIVADQLFASRERELLSRLEIGLADEGVRVIQALPAEGGLQASASGQMSGLCAPVVTFASTGLPFTTGYRARKLADKLDEIDSGTEESPVDIVHVFGGSLWNFGIALAESCGAAVALEIWRAGLIERASVPIASVKDVMMVAPDPGIERALRQRGLPTRLASWGVHAAETLAPKLEAGRATTVMLIGGGNDQRAMRAALEGLGACIRKHPDTLVFADALAARRAGLYELAMKLGMLANLSLIEEMESRRDLLVQGDVLILCEGHGEQRTIMLDAMSHAMVVLSVEDRFCEVLREGVTARLIKGPSAGSWAEAIGAVLQDPAGARRLGESARAFIAEHRRASDHVKAVLEAYSWLRRDRAVAPMVP